MNQDTQTLENFLALVREQSKEEFVENHEHPFLVEEVTKKDEEKNFEFATLQISKEEVQALLGLGAGGAAQPNVRKVVKRASNAFEGMINVGRTGNNDIVLDYQAISKFHAYFTKDPGEQVYYLTDADSTNCTFVNNQQLEPHQKHRLSEVDIISFAHQVDLRYYSPGGFYEMVSLINP